MVTTTEALSEEAVQAVHADLRTAAEHAPDTVRKAIAQAFVQELRVEDDHLVQPTFRVLPTVPAESLASGDGFDPAGTGVRTMTTSVGAEGLEPPTSSL